MSLLCTVKILVRYANQNSNPFIFRLSCAPIFLALTLSTTCPNAIAENTPVQSNSEDTTYKGKGAASFTQRPEEYKRPEEQLILKLFNRPLTIGGKIKTDLRSREDSSLGRRDDNDLRFSTDLQVELLYQITPDTSFYVEIDASYQEDLYSEDGNTESTSQVESGEFWLYMEGFKNKNLSLQIGRQYFGDEREWWWDKKLDAVRIQYADNSFNTLFAIGTNPTTISTEKEPLDPEYENIIWILTSADWEWKRKNHFEIFFLSRFDRSDTPDVGDIVPKTQEDEEDATVNWFGLRSHGRVKTENSGKFYYWFDSGMAYGKETLIDFDDLNDTQRQVDSRSEYTLSSWGVDIGTTWETKLPYQPRFTLGYAKGSGDKNPNDEMDSAYRQSGLQSNDDKLRGVNSFRYYGELLRPELSNLTIKTFALGFPLFNDSSLELVYHRYQQVYAADQLRNARIRTKPEGEHRDIGEEFNLILGLEEWEQLELELIATYFRAGKAYGEYQGQTASSITLKIQYGF